MRILALDLAKLFGWALGSTDAGVESFGRYELPTTEAWNLGEYGMAARMAFRRALDTIKPELVVYEAPILRSGKIKHRGNGKAFVATIDTPGKLRKIYGLPWELEIECHRAGITVREANNSEVLAHFLCGKVPRERQDRKIAVKVLCRRLGWEVQDDNEADALAILDRELAIQNPGKTLVRRINAGPSARLSSSGAGAFARSPAPGPQPTKAKKASRSPSAGRGGASSTTQNSPGAITATGAPSPAAMSSTSSPSLRRQQSLRLAASTNLASRR